jgi:two-component system response regulator
MTADILLVEDEPNDAELTLRALRDCGLAHRVEHVTDGAEALDYLAAANHNASKDGTGLPKLILLDLRLHKIGGLQVLRQLKSDERTRGIPIVVFSSSKMAIEIIESYKFGVNSYVLKPTDGKEFARVASAIGHYWLSINTPAQV